ncbi:hypothetical protein JX266_013870 [Neoarthrinium moseri]|nr:hypothetical protein JX266_013870 [Neoarthrinium moseri]
MRLKWSKSVGLQLPAGHDLAQAREATATGAPSVHWQRGKQVLRAVIRLQVRKSTSKAVLLLVTLQTDRPHFRKRPFLFICAPSGLLGARELMDISGHQRFGRVSRQKCASRRITAHYEGIVGTSSHSGRVMRKTTADDQVYDLAERVRMEATDARLCIAGATRRITAHHEGITAHGKGIVGTSPHSGRVMKDNCQDQVYDS